MAGENSPSDNRYYLKGVEALYPRINQPYRFDREKGKKGLTVPCNASDDQAAYEMSVRMSKEKAVPLYKAMKEEYARRGMAGWPAMPKYSEVFEIDSDGMFIAKTKLKAINKFRQFMKNKILSSLQHIHFPGGGTLRKYYPPETRL